MNTHTLTVYNAILCACSSRGFATETDILSNSLVDKALVYQILNGLRELGFINKQQKRIQTQNNRAYTISQYTIGKQL